MSSTKTNSTRPQHIHLKVLTDSFKVFQDCLPLAIGIHKVIQERLPNMGAKDLRNVMKLHTSSTRYLKALSNAETRFDLDGNPTNEVTAEERQHALGTLRARFRRAAEREKAEQEAKQHAESLQRLAQKFNSR